MSFDEAAARVKTLAGSPDNDEMLTLYGLFKQGTVGDVNTARPGMFDLTGKAKWDAWESKKGKSQDQAKKEYVDFVETLVAKYGTK